MDQRVKSQKIIREIIRERETTSFFSSLFISLITGVCSAAVLGLLLRGGSKGQIKGMKEKATIQFKAGEFIFPREEETNSDWLNELALPDWEIEKIKVLIRVREHALLYGPPGSGKSHLAKELAKNVSVAYISVSLGEEIFSGSGKAKCDNLLREAKEVLENQKKKAENDPDQKINPVVIIVDEIDSIGVKSFSPGRNGAETTNNFLGIINNIEDQKLNIRVIGITNYHEVLDPAVVRCGRLGFQIEINYPQQEEELNRIVDHLVKDKEFIKETEKLSINFAEDYWNEVKKITWEEKEKCSPETGISLIDIKKALSRSWCKEGISDANSAEAYRFWLQDIIKGKPKPRRGDIGLETILNPLASFFSGRREFSES